MLLRAASHSFVLKLCMQVGALPRGNPCKKLYNMFVRVERRFCQYFHTQEPFGAISAALDPRYKDLKFLDPEFQDAVFRSLTKTITMRKPRWERAKLWPKPSTEADDMEEEEEEEDDEANELAETADGGSSGYASLVLRILK